MNIEPVEIKTIYIFRILFRSMLVFLLYERMFHLLMSKELFRMESRWIHLGPWKVKREMLWRECLSVLWEIFFDLWMNNEAVRLKTWDISEPIESDFHHFIQPQWILCRVCLFFFSMTDLSTLTEWTMIS